MTRGTTVCALIAGALSLVATPGLAESSAGYRQLALGGSLLRWLPSSPSAPIELRYRLGEEKTDQPDAINCRQLQPPTTLLRWSGIGVGEFRRALSEAFQRWRDAADITFAEAEPGSKADIVVGEQGDPTGFAFTNVELGDRTPEGITPIVGASICLNPARKWKIGYDGNLAIYDLVHTLTHEIGHAIGLDHPGGRDHLMSFRYTETVAGLSEGDRRGAVAIYGPSRSPSTVVALPVARPDASPGMKTIVVRGIDSRD